ncbi:hypothetical protein A3A79_02050 [Candidatus Gottesmanbacteria bacterium RIFCSPLOWO2_01_FULL_43_11b]|uniref:Uncharacterized protein n=1 Tax=Candidatus Gottesmanbacteria bacterium RIFCSPLOWO2_01_FULL_43_11b TaxID=1798392 RepID=A0A1F6AHW0_9BACT|nr:MAG: hypothetical protein A3A79_02050 [Candidatus Gottesmanbacteria bacterium RIFCSPLOWO2_01_FULL_43_11b]
MKKKRSRRTHHRARVVRTKPSENYLVVVRSWMLVVLFAIMLGVGAVVGTFLNTQLNVSSPQVAGVEVELK